MADAINGFPAAIDGQQRSADQLPSLALGQRLPDHHIHRPIFVFQCHEGHAPGRLRPLPQSDDTGMADVDAVREFGQLP